MSAPLNTEGSPPTAESFPQTFGRYVLTDRIGAGGMAEIFRALTVGSEGFRRVLVVKRIRKSLDTSAQFLRMFIDEAKISALLTHPNIVQIYDFGQIDGAYFLAMEHVDGWDLSRVQHRLKEIGAVFPPSTAALIVQQVAHGLHHAHTLQSADGQPFNIVHRDVNPSNVMLVRTGSVKILDFGIAKASVAAGKAQTSATLIKGKLGYLSPEQARCERLDGRSDVFSLGTTLWEMLTGERLFSGATDLERIRNVLEAPIVPCSHRRPDIPPALDRIVLRALERDRARRYPSAEALADELDEFLRGHPAQNQAIKKLLGRLYHLDQIRNTASLPAVQVPTAVTVVKAEPSSTAAEPGPAAAPQRSTPGVAAPRSRRAGPVIWMMAASLLVVSAAVVTFVFRSAPAVRASTSGSAAALAREVRIEVASDPSGATVYGRRGRLGITPVVLTLPVSAEVEQLRLEKPGFARQTRDLRPKSAGFMFVELREAGASAPPSANDRRECRIGFVSTSSYQGCLRGQASHLQRELLPSGAWTGDQHGGFEIWGMPMKRTAGGFCGLVGWALAALASLLAGCVSDPATASEPNNEVLTASFAGSGGGMDRQLAELRRMIRSSYGVALPPMPVPVNNPQSDKKVALGEALFFDPNLSACGTIACASCHIPERGFSDGQQISDGCSGATGRRNSNTVYGGGFLSHAFWDGRVQSLEQQALGPVVDGAEMANTWDNVLGYLQTGLQKGLGKQFPGAKSYYQRAFGKVFGGEMSTTTVSKAIASYERTVNSFGAPYDQWVQGNDRALSDAQQKGMLVFFGRGQCVACHAPPLFTDSDFHNLGVPNAGFESPAKFPFNADICRGIRTDADPGRGEVAFLRSSCSDLGKFKTPTLRNLTDSGPYMHNGVFATIEDSVAHFDKLAQGTALPVVGTIDPLVAKGTILFGHGGGQADDLKNMTEFLKALTGSQMQSPKGGVAPPK